MPSYNISIIFVGIIHPLHFPIDSIVFVRTRIIAITNNGICDIDERPQIHLPDGFVVLHDQ